MCIKTQATTGSFSQPPAIGLDTTTSALAAMFFYLSRYEAVYDKVVNEIRSAFAQEDDVQPGPALRSCAVFQACINEALRMSTPIGSCPAREAGEGGEVVDGHFIPEGTMIGTGLYSLHHNEANFPNPDAFTPERWLVVDNDNGDGSPVTAAGAHDKTTGCGLHVFLAGARACIGQGLALTEIQFIMARCIWRYDFRAAPGPNRQVGAGSQPRPGDQRAQGRYNPDEFQLLDRITSLKDGPVIQFRQRRR